MVDKRKDFVGMSSMNEDIVVLLVDDAKFARKIAKKALNNAGIDNIIEAVNAHDAMKLLEEKNPDIVLLDITLPDNSDLTLLRNMIQAKPEIKIIMTSAIGQDLIIEDALREGAKAFVTKPFGEKEFLKEVFRVLEEKN